MLSGSHSACNNLHATYTITNYDPALASSYQWVVIEGTSTIGNQTGGQTLVHSWTSQNTAGMIIVSTSSTCADTILVQPCCTDFVANATDVIDNNSGAIPNIYQLQPSPPSNFIYNPTFYPAQATVTIIRVHGQLEIATTTEFHNCSLLWIKEQVFLLSQANNYFWIIQQCKLGVVFNGKA